EADAEDRCGRREAVDDGKADAGLARRFRPGRKQDRLRREAFYLFEADLVVAIDDRLGAELADIVNEVIGEAVVVIDDEEFHGSVPARSAENAMSLPPKREVSISEPPTPSKDGGSRFGGNDVAEAGTVLRPHCPTLASPA